MNQYGTLIVRRNASAKKSAFEALVCVDDEIVGSVRNGEDFRIRIPTGECRVKIAIGETYCSEISVAVNEEEPTTLVFSAERDVCRFEDYKETLSQSQLDAQNRSTTILVFLRFVCIFLLGMITYKVFAMASQIDIIVDLLQKRF